MFLKDPDEEGSSVRKVDWHSQQEVEDVKNFVVLKECGWVVL
jgi:hypothetical protein